MSTTNATVNNLLKIRGVGRFVRNWVRSDQNRFISFYEWLEKEDIKGLESLATGEEWKQYRDALAEHGVVKVPSVFSDEEFVSEWRQFQKSIFQDYDKFQERIVEGQRNVRNEDFDMEYWYPPAYDKDHKLFGRKRCFFKKDSKCWNESPLNKIVTSPLITDFGKENFHPSTEVKGVLVEILSPSIESDFWHIDNCRDQLKAMILMTDVDENSGPLRYKQGTHRKRDKVLSETLYESAIRGLDYGYPPAPLVRKMPGEEYYGTGKAGDVLFFNTLGLHSGTRCRSGERVAIVIYYKTTNQKTKGLRGITRH